MMKTKWTLGLIGVLLCTLTVVIFAQREGASVPAVELNALFAAADKDENGSLSKEEFEGYLLLMRRQKPKQNSPQGRICPNTGQLCSSDGEGCGGGGAGCCSHDGLKTAADAAPAKSGCGGCSKGASGGGCCSQGNGKTAADATPAKSGCGGCSKGASGGGCCSSKGAAPLTAGEKDERVPPMMGPTVPAEQSAPKAETVSETTL